MFPIRNCKVIASSYPSGAFPHSVFQRIILENTTSRLEKYILIRPYYLHLLFRNMGVLCSSDASLLHTQTHIQQHLSSLIKIQIIHNEVKKKL